MTEGCRVKGVMEEEVLELLSRGNDWCRRGQKNPETAGGKKAMG